MITPKEGLNEDRILRILRKLKFTVEAIVRSQGRRARPTWEWTPTQGLSDAATEFSNAAKRLWPEISWRMCNTHVVAALKKTGLEKLKNPDNLDEILKDYCCMQRTTHLGIKNYVRTCP